MGLVQNLRGISTEGMGRKSGLDLVAQAEFEPDGYLAQDQPVFKLGRDLAIKAGAHGLQTPEQCTRRRVRWGRLPFVVVRYRLVILSLTRNLCEGRTMNDDPQ